MANETTLIDKVKASQRVTNDLVNEDYAAMITACKDELQIVLGLSEDKVIDTDPEVIQACKLYVHWLTDYEGKGAQWGVMYANYVNTLRMIGDYTEESEA